MSEKIKNYLGLAIIVAVLGVGLAAMSAASSYARSIGPGAYRTFSTSGEGEAIGVPDVAQFSFQVITEGDEDIVALQSQNTEKVNQAIAFLKGKGIDAKDIRTENYNVGPRYQTNNCNYRLLGENKICPPPEIVGYTITQGVSVKVRDFKVVGEVLAGVVEKGANSVSRLDFTVDKPEALESQARAEAVAQAKSKAEAVARAAGFRLGRLISISEDEFPMPHYKSLEMNDASVAVPSIPTIEPGSQELHVSLTLTYEIE
ncbi:MAG: SIMPL domain-containing protein [Candidatus Vogelbacteria bacterium]|nr:SIMPL domain-containing protein [Candidatus Vogelbacteria bacterium]